MPEETTALAEPSTNGKVRLTAEVGTSGLKQYGGYIHEEYDPDLRGLRGIRTYEEMRKADPTVAIGLRAIGWVLGGVNWSVQPGGETPADTDAAAFLESCLEDMSHTWSKVIRDALTCLPFGWAYQEWTLKQRAGTEADPPSRYDDGKLGWRKISLIGQETLTRWDMDETGGIRGMVQQDPYTAGSRQGETTIPIEKAVLFRLDDEKNNPEGVSLLRAVYLPWYLKKNLQEIEAIGIERDLTGVLVIHLPVNANADDQAKARDLLEQFKADDMSGFTAPQFGPGDHERWRFEILASPGSKGIDVDRVIKRYQHEIARSFLTQFLLLGQGTTGSWALGRDQREMFEVALSAILMNIEETMNRFLVPPLFRINQFGKLSGLPQLRAGRISKGDMSKFADSMGRLVEVGLLTTNRDLETFVRSEMDLPELPEEEEEEKPEEDTGGQKQQAKEFSLTPAQKAEIEAESARIKENQKTSAAQKRHKFKSAEWTHPNGHPRCLICGDEERVGGYCEGLGGQKQQAAEDAGEDEPGDYDDSAEDAVDEILRDMQRAVTGKGLAERLRFDLAGRRQEKLARIRREHEAGAKWLTDRYQAQMTGLAADLREGRLSQAAWAKASRAEIENMVRASHKLGLAQARGIRAPGDMHLTEADRLAANRQVKAQLKYFAGFRKDVAALLKEGKELTTALDVRAGMYGGALKGVIIETHLTEAKPAAKLRWVRTKSDSCETCIAAEGRSQTWAEWQAEGLWPSHGTLCLTNCGCSLEG